MPVNHKYHQTRIHEKLICPGAFGNSIFPILLGLWFNYGILDGFMKKWLVRKDELKAGAISKDEYFKLNIK